MARRTLISGGTAITVDAGAARRDAIEPRGDIIGRAAGSAGARIGGEWITEAYVAVQA